MNPARRATVATALAGTVTLLVAGAVWRYGIVPVPRFPALAISPDPSIAGTVTFRGDDECLRVVPAAGGTVQRAGLCDGRRFDFDSADRGEPRLADGSEVEVPYGDEEQRARIVARSPVDGTERTLVSVRAPADYSFETVVVSPDRRFLLVVDSEGRLLVGPADGSSGLRLLATGAEPYGRPVWHQPMGAARWSQASPPPASR